LSGLIIAALLAALMSSLSSVFNSCSTLITMDIYKKFRPQATESRLVAVGRWVTVAVVAVSILWIPMVRLLSDQVFQYLQSVQAYVGAPITAVFLTGVLWKGATPRAAIVTLIVGGLAGAGRFLLDILHNALKIDLGPLNGLVAFSFLNFSVLVFLGCVALMILVSRASEPKMGIEQLTVAGTRIPARAGDLAWTAAVGIAIVSLWYYFA
jgi:SSS family solute:Na+ symporter